ncbi:MAG: glycoside hydrolase family 18 protein, partial [Anaerolineae bacterium]|nr:glycoside hydrolase family 18 protein [Anaerolineae bacterium]
MSIFSRYYPKHRIALAALSLVFLFNLAPLISEAAPSSPATSLYRIVGYYTSWSIYAPQYDITQIPAAQLTHLNYAFATISDSGECALGDAYADTQYPYADGASGNMGELLNLKANHPQLKTLISVGGYTWSGHFSDVAASVESRQHFAASCVDFMLAHGFDGIDIDWEFPVGTGAKGNSQRPEDGENFILLLQELRTQLTERGNLNGQTYLLTIAAGSDREQYAMLDWKRIHPLLDWINVMTYDMSGARDGTTGLNAPLYPSSTRPDKPSID